jgi:hypothetical protein
MRRSCPLSEAATHAFPFPVGGAATAARGVAQSATATATIAVLHDTHLAAARGASVT